MRNYNKKIRNKTFQEVFKNFIMKLKMEIEKFLNYQEPLTK